MSDRTDFSENAFQDTPLVEQHQPGFTVELGDQLFTEAQWNIVQQYARGYALTKVNDDGLNMQEGVRRFHEAMGQPVGTVARALPADRIPVRVELIREEFYELLEALGWQGEQDDEGHYVFPENPVVDMVEAADAAVDIVYVTLGLLVEKGMNIYPLFREVQESNMSKLGEDGKGIIAGPNDPDGVFEGRVKKGPYYFRPRLAEIIGRGEADLENL